MSHNPGFVVKFFLWLHSQFAFVERPVWTSELAMLCVCLQVHYILQEVVMGGMVLETNMNEIVAQVEVQNRMEKSEVGVPVSLHSSSLAS